MNLCDVTDALYAKDLIPQQTKEEMHVLGVTNKEKASKLVNIIEQQLQSSLNPEQYLTEICHVLINQKHRTLTNIATSILHQLGECVCTLSVINIVIIPYSRKSWQSFILVTGGLQVKSPKLKPSIVNAHAQQCKCTQKLPN